MVRWHCIDPRTSGRKVDRATDDTGGGPRHCSAETAVYQPSGRCLSVCGGRWEGDKLSYIRNKKTGRKCLASHQGLPGVVEFNFLSACLWSTPLSPRIRRCTHRDYITSSHDIWETAHTSHPPPKAAGRGEIPQGPTAANRGPSVMAAARV